MSHPSHPVDPHSYLELEQALVVASCISLIAVVGLLFAIAVRIKSASVSGSFECCFPRYLLSTRAWSKIQTCLCGRTLYTTSSLFSFVTSYKVRSHHLINYLAPVWTRYKNCNFGGQSSVEEPDRIGRFSYFSC